MSISSVIVVLIFIMMMAMGKCLLSVKGEGVALPLLMLFRNSFAIALLVYQVLLLLPLLSFLFFICCLPSERFELWLCTSGCP